MNIKNNRFVIAITIVSIIDCLIINNIQKSRIILKASSDDKFKTSLSSSLSWSKTKRSKRERIKNVLARARRRTSSNGYDISGHSGDCNGTLPKNGKILEKKADACNEAFSSFTPLPFTLPTLTNAQKQELENGERVQHQQDMGREGSGFVVVDVKAPSEIVWQCLLDFESYPTLIDTVRDVTMYTSTHLNQEYYHEDPVAVHKLKHGVPSVTRAAFTLSKFRLNIAAIHSYTPHPLGDHMIFTLDPACTNLVLRAAKGIWYTEKNPDGKGEDWTRVWLLCEVKVSPVLPMWITYYAAKRAMPRATTWLKPTVEQRFNNICRKN